MKKNCIWSTNYPPPYHCFQSVRIIFFSWKILFFLAAFIIFIFPAFHLIPSCDTWQHEYSALELRISTPLRLILTASDSWRVRGSLKEDISLNLSLGGAFNSGWSSIQCLTCWKSPWFPSLSALCSLLRLYREQAVSPTYTHFPSIMSSFPPFLTWQNVIMFLYGTLHLLQ